MEGSNYNGKIEEEVKSGCGREYREKQLMLRGI